MVEQRPSSLREALEILAEGKHTPLAGGTDLMVRFRSTAKGAAAIDSPLMIGPLEELQGLSTEGETLRIGPCTSLADLIGAQELPPVFKAALAQIGSPAIRHQGTLGGNICNASPAGDSLPLLYLFKADLELTSREGSRIVSLDDFITGPGRTVRKEEELLTKIVLDRSYLSPRYAYAFEKMGNRKADAISKASFGLRIAVEGGRLTDMEAAFGAMGPKVTLVKGEEFEGLLNRPFPLVGLEKSVLRKVLFSRLTPIDDQRSTADYRKRVALNLLHHYLTTHTILNKQENYEND
ncbi:MAG: FAD binding domain-containing protein [Spirochaetales bacterium]|nr:FAD binding domain-containing protein [Spirochaetales bacterium]